MEKLNVEDLNIKDKVIHISRVAKVVKGGRRFGFSALVVAGDPDANFVGIGLGKAKEVPEAIRKGTEQAKKNLIRVKVHNNSIPHEQYGKSGAGYVFMKPAPEGTGIIAGGAMRAIFELSGVRNVYAKSIGSSNPHNVANATLKCISSFFYKGELVKRRKKSEINT
ncbi:MAG: 30S ribosomal protein S5 [bacterium]